MSATPIQRLACSLKALGYVERRRLPARAGVGPTAVMRAYSEQATNPVAYIKLCGALGITVATGESCQARTLGEFDWNAFALGFEMKRRLQGMSLRQAEDALGQSKATLSRLENGKPVSINGVIAVCKFIGTTPEHYCLTPGMIHVKRTRETRRVAA